MSDPNEIIMENLLCLHLANIHMTPNRLMDYHESRQGLSTKLPTFLGTYHPGSYIFVIKFQEQFNKEDVYRDALGPWSGNGTKSKTKLVTVNGKDFRQARFNHPTIVGLRKLVLSDDDKAVIAYNFTHAVDNPGGSVVGRKMTLPSTLKTVRKELQGRTVKSTHVVMKNTSKPVGRQAIRDASKKVETCIKLNTGPVKPTSIGELLDIAAPYTFRCQVDNENEKSKPVIIFTVMLDKAISLFSMDCPTWQQLNVFQNAVKMAIEDNEFPDQGEFNNSLFIPGMESQVSFDTTFGLSNLYVTLIIGKLASYRTKRSHKDRPILLGLMLHTLKNSKAHEVLGEAFTEAWKRLAPRKYIPSFIRDGEAAFAQVTKDRRFGDATQLRCDLHLLQNLLGPTGVAHKDAKYLVGIVQGKNIKPGLLQMTTEEDFQDYLNKLATKVPHLYRKILPRQDEIFEYHSRRAKLLAGWGARYGTTNSSEGYNQMVKNYVPRRMPGDQVLKNLIKMHEDEMAEVEAARKLESDVMEYHTRLRFQWPPLLKDSSSIDTSTDSTRESTVNDSSHDINNTSMDSTNFEDSIQERRNTSMYSLSESSLIFPSQVNNTDRSNMKSTFAKLQRAHIKREDGSKRKGKQSSKGNYKRICYEPLNRRVIDTTVESMDSMSSCPPEPFPGYEDEDIPLMELSRRSLSQVPWDE